MTDRTRAVVVLGRGPQGPGGTGGAAGDDLTVLIGGTTIMAQSRQSFAVGCPTKQAATVAIVPCGTVAGDHWTVGLYNTSLDTDVTIQSILLQVSSADGTQYLGQEATSVVVPANTPGGISIALPDLWDQRGTDLVYSAPGGVGQIATTAGGAYGVTCVIRVAAAA